MLNFKWTNKFKKAKEKKEPPKTVEDSHKIIYNMATVFIIMFVILIGNLVYIAAFKQEEFSVHSGNKRLNRLEDEVERGDIYESEMKLIATNDDAGNRKYPYGNLYSHPVGYSQNGKMGIEARANQQLLYPSYDIASLFGVAFNNSKLKGRDVVLTLEHSYQEQIAKGMGERRGGVVVLEATTGKVKALYSSPNFNPNEIVEDWSSLNTDNQNTPLVNRATKGLYPPGSIFKIVTALAYMQSYSDEGLDFTHDCTGSIKGDDYDIQCYGHSIHGKVDLNKAFEKSCNTYFIALLDKLPKGALTKAAQQVGYNNALNFDMDYSVSKFNLKEDGVDISSDFEKAATAIGQGRTLTSPLHMATLAATIVNDGIEMKPYYIDYVMDKRGRVKTSNKPQQIGPVMTETNAKMLQELMENVLDHGTAVTLAEKGLVVGGKTGTAENETDKDHSWFMGYAKDPNGNKPPIAFAVVVEGGGKGAQALDVSHYILEAYRQDSE